MSDAGATGRRKEQREREWKLSGLQKAGQEDQAGADGADQLHDEGCFSGGEGKEADGGIVRWRMG